MFFFYISNVFCRYLIFNFVFSSAFINTLFFHWIIILSLRQKFLTQSVQCKYQTSNCSQRLIIRRLHFFFFYLPCSSKKSIKCFSRIINRLNHQDKKIFSSWSLHHSTQALISPLLRLVVEEHYRPFWETFKYHRKYRGC